MSLTKYQSKRHFDTTPEPAGKPKPAGRGQLEFVVQKHHASHLHYDFRLELDGVMKSWAVPKGPSLNPKDKRLAMMVEDHPYEYRKFEGVIPKGNYGAGNVIIWDRGTYRPLTETPDQAKTLKDQLKKGHLTFILEGQKLRGEFALIKTPYKGDNAWLLVKKADEYAGQASIISKDRSVLSGKKVDDLAADKIDLADTPVTAMPDRVKPMLASLVSQPFDRADWSFEIKWDGYRALGSWDGAAARLYSRSGNNFTNYKPINAALRRLSHHVVIDGEIVAANQEGRANFGWLQNYAKRPKGQLIYYAFDILWCDGHDLTDLPLKRRKEILRKAISGNPVIRYSDHIETRGVDFFQLAAAKNLEGIVAKDLASRYEAGARSRQWLKIKTHLRQEAVIGGFTEPRGSRKDIGAVILGAYDEDGRLRYIGHTGGGIPPKLAPDLRRQLEDMAITRSPFHDKFKPNAPAHWARPELVCEVQFAEWTDDGHMRQPIFLGLRSDKPATEITIEKPIRPMHVIAKSNRHRPAGRLEFSHLDKVFFPDAGYSKGDLVDYYRSVAKLMLPYIRNRPHSLLRQPNGIDGEAFFQKDMDHMPPDWVRTEPIFSESNNKDINYLVADSTDSLLYMVQLGCIEINPWNSRLANLAKPDWCVIDLDPEAISFTEVVKAARSVNEVCSELQIPCYPKTSGKTGLHIYIPLRAKYTYEQCKQFGQLLATLVHQRLPDTTSLERSPKKRQHKVYIDYLQNRAGQTLAAPYSVRPTPAASVSTPLDWSEVKAGLKPEDFTIKNIAKRLDEIGDIWRPVIGKGVDIGKILEKIS